MGTKTDKWAKGLWQKASNSWKTREQDNNYRKYLVHSSLERELADFRAHKGILVDIGCGEGGETAYLHEYLKDRGIILAFGFDTNTELIEHAIPNYKKICFSHGETRELMEVYGLLGKVDLVSSLFVLQDTPYARDLIEASCEALKDGGTFFSVIVNPKFAEAIDEKGELRKKNIHESPRRKEHRFVAEYPIVERGGKPFFVPYFHRTLGDYVSLIEEYFTLDSLNTLKPSEELLEKSEREKILPFCNEKGNIYWPEISKIPSSVIIKARK